MYASIELSEELEKLSGWKANWQHDTVNGGVKFAADASTTPAYDLGLLLRKLPHTIEKCPEGSLTLYIYDNEWACGYEGGDVECFRPGDTPENAACALAIFLWKEGILTP